MAEHITTTVNNFGIRDRVWGFAGDNASNNVAMMTVLGGKGWKRFSGSLSYIRCYAHVLQLMFGAALIDYRNPSASIEDPTSDIHEEEEDEDEEEDSSWGLDGSEPNSKLDFLTSDLTHVPSRAMAQLERAGSVLKQVSV